MKLQKCCILPSIFLFSCTVSIFAGTMGELNRPYHAEETLDLTHHHFALGTAYTNYPSSSFWGTLGGMTEHFFWRLAAAGVLLRHQPPEVGSFNFACGTAIAAYRHPFTTILAWMLARLLVIRQQTELSPMAPSNIPWVHLSDWTTFSVITS